MADRTPVERRITDQIMCELKLSGGWWFKTHGGAMQVAGIPDIIGVYRGSFFGLEVKRPNAGVATRLQLDTLRKIYYSGGVAAIVTSVADVQAVLKRYDQLQAKPKGDQVSLAELDVLLRTWSKTVE